MISTSPHSGRPLLTSLSHGAPLEHGSPPPLSFKTQPRYHFMGRDLPWPSTPALHSPPTEAMLLSPGRLSILCYTFISLRLAPVYKSVSPRGCWIPWRQRLWYIHTFLKLSTVPWMSQGLRKGIRSEQMSTSWALQNTSQAWWVSKS